MQQNSSNWTEKTRTLWPELDFGISFDVFRYSFGEIKVSYNIFKDIIYLHFQEVTLNSQITLLLHYDKNSRIERQQYCLFSVA